MKKIFFLLLFGSITNLFAQNEVKLRVYDALTMEPLSNVSLVAENSQMTAISDYDGSIVLQSLKEGTSLKFSHIGYEDYFHIYSVGTNPELTAGELKIMMIKKTYQAPEFR
jgi:hypothetical protein